jgi:hypothetical protein
MRQVLDHRVVDGQQPLGLGDPGDFYVRDTACGRILVNLPDLLAASH